MTQRKLAAKTGRERPLLERIVNCGFRLKEVAHRQDECGNEVYQKDRPDRFMEPKHVALGVLRPEHISRPCARLRLPWALACRDLSRKPTSARTWRDGLCLQRLSRTGQY